MSLLEALPNNSNWPFRSLYAEGPYVVARAGFEPATLRSKGIDSTNVSQRPT